MVQYVLARFACGAFGCLPTSLNLEIADAVADVFYGSNRRRREKAYENLRLAYPDWPEEQVRRTAQRSMRHMFRMFMVESLRISRMISQETWARHMKIGSVEPIMELLSRKSPAIFITGHCGNWELPAQALAAIGYPLVALARPIDNPYINRWVMQTRETRGSRIVTKWGGTTILQDVLGAGGRVGFIADQNAGDDGLFVPFFNKLASSYKSIAILAMRYRAPIVTAIARRIGAEIRYELVYTDIIRPEEWDEQPDPIFYVTARFNRGLERAIRLAPEQYLWIHRRWKSRPRFELEGKAMPGRMVEKLRSLPWMTEADLAVIVARSEAESAMRRGAAGDRAGGEAAAGPEAAS